MYWCWSCNIQFELAHELFVHLTGHTGSRCYRAATGEDDNRCLVATCPFCAEEILVRSQYKSDEPERLHLEKCPMFLASVMSGVNYYSCCSESGA